MKKYIMLLLLITLIPFFAACDDTEEDDEEPDECEEAPFYCETIEPDYGDLHIDVSGDNITVYLYKGTISEGEEYTEYNIDGSLTIEDLAVGTYSAKAFYRISGKTVIAVDSGDITVKSNDYCDGVTCYSIEDADIDVTFEKDAFEEYLANEDDACFIATAAYGSLYDVHVLKLRKFRDDVLMKSPAGRAFVRAYYYCSPPVASAVSKSPLLKKAVRSMLDPLVSFTDTVKSK